MPDAYTIKEVTKAWRSSHQAQGCSLTSQRGQLIDIMLTRRLSFLLEFFSCNL